jgi:hypothetical protein
MDVAHGETVEAELKRLVEKRSSKELDPDEQEEIWKASVRACNARNQEAMRLAWCEYHRGQGARLRRTVEPLIAFHETRARALLSRELNGTERKGHMG